MTLNPGSRVGHYRILAPLGAGGMGEVWLAEDDTLKRKVALKVLPGLVAADPERLARFQREAEAVAALTHPNIVTIHSIEQDGDVRFLTMEFVEGQSLDRLIARGGMPLPHILDVGSALADALAASHEKGIVHRDVKPANIMMTADRRVKVLDFGLAKLQEDFGVDTQTTVAHATGEGRLLGTVAYMSPEQAEGRTVDARSDLFSLGIVLFEMSTGDRPFAGDSNLSTLSAILRDTPRAVTDLRADLPRELDRIIRRALQKDPEQRYQTAKDLRNDLQLLRTDLTSGALTGASSAVPTRGTRRSRIWMMAGAAVVVVGLAAAGIWRTRFQGPPSRPFESIRLKLVTDRGDAASPVVSPDGRYVAYTNSTRANLWLRQIATGSDVSIAPAGFASFFPAVFSRDGNLLYVYAEDDTKQRSLYRLPALGGAPRKVTDEGSWVSVSPDGARLALADPGNIFIAGSDGTNLHRLDVSVRPEFFAGISWSSDGLSLAALVRPEPAGRAAAARIVLIDIQTERQRDLGPLPIRVVQNMAGLPDGSGFLVVGTEPNANDQQIWLISHPDRQAHRVTNDLNAYWAPSVTADGRTLVAEQRSGHSGIWVFDPKDPASTPRQIASSRTGREGWLGLAWMKDGRLLYSSNATGNAELWSAGADGSAARQLTFTPTTDINPAVSPDGSIVWQVGGNPRPEIWRMEADGSNAGRLTGEGVFPFFGPDPGWVFFSDSTTAPWTSWKVPIGGGTRWPLFAEPTSAKTARDTAVPAGFTANAISPDGRWIAGRVERAFGIVPTDDAGGWRALDIPGTVNAASLRWTFDSRSLAYVRSERGISNVWVQPIDGTPAKQLTTFTSQQISRLAWSGDGRTLALSRGETTIDLVMITSDTRK
jgi:serine/threonine protein kinase/Tol biopolymer transport system component